MAPLAMLPLGFQHILRFYRRVLPVKQLTKVSCSKLRFSRSFTDSVQELVIVQWMRKRVALKTVTRHAGVAVTSQRGGFILKSFAHAADPFEKKRRVLRAKKCQNGSPKGIILRFAEILKSKLPLI